MGTAYDIQLVEIPYTTEQREGFKVQDKVNIINPFHHKVEITAGGVTKCIVSEPPGQGI